MITILDQLKEQAHFTQTEKRMQFNSIYIEGFFSKQLITKTWIGAKACTSSNLAYNKETIIHSRRN